MNLAEKKAEDELFETEDKLLGAENELLETENEESELLEIEDEENEFGNFIRYMRGSVGMNQQVFGEKLGIRPSRISKYERGISSPPKTKRNELEKQVRSFVKSEIARLRLGNKLQYGEEDNFSHSIGLKKEGEYL